MPHDEFVTTIEAACADKALWQIFDAFQGVLEAKLTNSDPSEPFRKTVNPHEPSEEAVAAVIVKLLESM